MHVLFDSIVSALIAFISKVGYFGIFLGMFIESTPIPLPSELIMIPAGIAASKGLMSLALILFCGILGNVLGAIFSYFLALYLGRAVLFRVGKYFFLKPEAIVKIEDFFNRHGAISVFIGRIIIGVRHLISLPAGVAKMNLKLFCLYTFLGSTIWSSALTFFGYFVGKNEELVKHYLDMLALGALGFCAVLVLVYMLLKKKS